MVGARDEDLPRDQDLPQSIPIQRLLSRIGTTKQRNVGIEAAAASDLIVFIDDDFLMAEDFLAEAERLFASDPSIAMATGTLLADGIHGPGIPIETALSQLQGLGAAENSSVTEVYNAYGCNMILRSDLVARHGIRFDAKLPLYGWLEDVDFSRQMARHGRIVKSSALRGVHLGTKTGRSSGRRIGYSQIANPLYLRSKNTMIRKRAYMMMARNVLANLVKSLRPEPEIDRRGRLMGNVLALADLISGGLTPERIMELE